VPPRAEHPVPERSLPKCFDPYLRYAIATDFRTFESFEEESFRLFFLVEFKRAGLGTAFRDRMTEAGFDIELRPDDDQSRYVTLRSRQAAVTELSAFSIWDEFVSRVELSLPIKPSPVRPPMMGMMALAQLEEEARAQPRSVLIGILDDGCPFAATRFRKASGSTRVLSIWDQTRDRDPMPVTDTNGNARLFGEAPTDFDYGLEFRRDLSPLAPPSQMGLDEWIALHSAAGLVDEDGCYADAEFTRLSRRQSHGAHVMDVLAGPVPTSARVGPSRPGEDRRDPPSWKVGTDPASQADLVFVQFSDECIRDATGVWLKAYVFDGIGYVLSFADPATIEKVVINISYGPTTGPHDGTALLEAALTAFVTEFNGTPGKPKLEIVLPAGNAYLSDGHVAFEGDKPRPTTIEWTWRLPPDNAVLCFAEIWIDNANAGGVTVTLTSPSGATSTSAPTPPPAGQPLPPYTGVYGPVVWGSHTMWLLAVEPTLLVAEHGDWKIKVTGIRKKAQVHAYVARSDPNMGVRTGAKRSYFVDHKWEATRSSEASCKYSDGEFDKTGSLIRRGGTLNGIATAKDASVHVAGGYVLANGRKSSYSSAGPARNGPLTLRVGPDIALPCDESYALAGIRAGGNRSGGVFRLTGTSAAAPQLARHVADPPIPAATNIPIPPEDAKRGGGNIEPP
jgi:hypothetical protein